MHLLYTNIIQLVKKLLVMNVVYLTWLPLLPPALWWFSEYVTN